MLKKEKKRSILSRIRNYFIAGIVVLIPIGITLYLTIFLISISSKILPKEINPNHYLPYSIPGVEILTSVILITLIGWLSLSFLGSRLLSLFNRILKQIPILRTIYSAIGQMTETFTKQDKQKKNVVLVEYPRKGCWAVGFATACAISWPITEANPSLFCVILSIPVYTAIFPPGIHQAFFILSLSIRIYSHWKLCVGSFSFIE